MNEVAVQSKPHLDSSLHMKDSLKRSLDDLLENSTAFFGMMRANFTNPNRIRYGQDFYDARMQASTTFDVHSSLKNSTELELLLHSLRVTTTLEKSEMTARVPEFEDEDGEESLARSTRKAKSTSTVPAQDPLRWFGILVPAALKASQASFRKTVTGTIPDLANVSNEMKQLEIEIRRTRKKIKKLG
ncbi:MAG: hypothetical protein Q9222_001863 [Ikaeria aurantiellina]